jgi:hypothetical protein
VGGEGRRSGAPSAGWWQRLRARPVLLGSLVAVGVGGVVFVLVWFQPQTLLFDEVVDEEFPVAGEGQDPTAATDEAPADAAAEPDDPVEGAAEGAEGAEAAPSGPIELAMGAFTSRSRYSVEGQATTFRLEDGSHLLRLEDFASTNGPDLFVYLTTADAEATDDELGAEFVDLGVLTGNIGNQNYGIPADVDLDRFDTVVIWCRRFTTAFGAADLTA